MSRDVTQILLDTRAYKEGEFTLASGAKSDFYIDCRIALLQSPALQEICKEVLAVIWKLWPQLETSPEEPIYIGGTGLGGSLLVAGCLVMDETNRMRGVYVRDVAKDHGAKKVLEGDLTGCQRVLLLEDVVTTGGSIIRALDSVRKDGFKVPAVICLVDRSEGSVQGMFANAECRLMSLTTPKLLREAMAVAQRTTPVTV